MLRTGAMPVSPAMKTTSRESFSGRRKSPNGPSSATTSPASSFCSAAPPRPGTDAYAELQRFGTLRRRGDRVGARDPSGKRKFTHWPG